MDMHLTFAMLVVVVAALGAVPLVQRARGQAALRTGPQRRDPPLDTPSAADIAAHAMVLGSGAFASGTDITAHDRPAC